MFHLKFKCILCADDKYDSIYVQEFPNEQDNSRDFFVTDNAYGRHYPIVKCRGCGFVTTLKPDKEYINSKYQEVKDPDYLLEEENRRIPFRKILERLGKQGGGPGKLLDIGAFCGLLLDEARSRGFDAVGVEPSKWAVEQARERYNVQIANDTFPTIRDIGSDFMYVTLIDLIEHVPDPVSVLTSVREHMTDDGIIAIVTPDFGSPARIIFGERWWHIRIAHLHYFDARSLTALLQRTGFRVIKQKGYIWHFSVSYLVSRLLNRRGLKWLNQFLNRSRWTQWFMNISVPVNFFDSFEWYCKKKG